MRIRNISPHGDQVVDIAGRTVTIAAGEVQDVPDEEAAGLLACPAIWEQVKGKGKGKPVTAPETTTQDAGATAEAEETK